MFFLRIKNNLLRDSLIWPLLHYCVGEIIVIELMRMCVCLFRMHVSHRSCVRCAKLGSIGSIDLPPLPLVLEFNKSLCRHHHHYHRNTAGYNGLPHRRTVPGSLSLSLSLSLSARPNKNPVLKRIAWHPMAMLASRTITFHEMARLTRRVNQCTYHADFEDFLVQTWSTNHRTLEGHIW